MARLADPIVAGYAAASDLKEMARAFKAVRADYVETLLMATDPAAALAGVMQVRALDDVEAQLRRVIDGGLIEQHAHPR